MALANYSDLKGAVASWLARTDLTTQIPDFITLAHKQLMRELRGSLRLQKRDSLVVSGEYVQAPSDFLELISIYNGAYSTPYSLQLLPSDTGTDTFHKTADYPRYISMTGGNSVTAGVEFFRFSPPSDATYTMTLEYYAKLADFSANADTNFVLTNHPDVYLYGALLQASAFVKNDPRIPMWQAAYQACIESLNSAGKKTRWGGPMTIRPG